jgi:hypothetical protein
MPQILSGLARALKPRAAGRERAPRLLDPVLQRERPDLPLDQDTIRARVKVA